MLLLSALILHSYLRFDVVCWLQNVHLKNKGSLPAEAVKPASTIGQQLLAVSLRTHTRKYMACSARPQATAACPSHLQLCTAGIVIIFPLHTHDLLLHYHAVHKLNSHAGICLEVLVMA